MTLVSHSRVCTPTAAGQRDTADPTGVGVVIVAPPGFALTSGDAITETTVDVTITLNDTYTALRVYRDGGLITTLAGNATSYQYTGLTANTLYDLAVIGVKGVIPSNPSQLLGIRTDQAPIPAERKYNPGHYFDLPRFQAASGAGLPAALVSQKTGGQIPGLKGGFKRYYWKEVNPTGSTFTWTALDADFAAFKAAGLRFMPMIVDKTFDGVDPMPADITNLAVNLTQGDSAGGIAAMRWNTTVQTRFNALMTAIANRYDADPMFEGVCFQETAINLTSAEQTATGYSKPLYRDGMINMLSHACDAFATSRVFWYMNFMNSGAGGAATSPDYLRAIANAVKSNNGVPRTGFTMGGPDILPESTSLTGVNGPYQLYPEFAGQFPLFCSAQFNSHDHAKASGGLYSMEEIFLFARDTLFVDYVIWTRDNVGTQTFDADDIPVINTYADFDSPLVTTPPAPTITFVGKSSTTITVSIAASGRATTLIPRIGGVDQGAIPATQTTYTFSSLTANTQYSVQFKAANSAGTSGASNTVTQTTDQTPANPSIWTPQSAAFKPVIPNVTGFGANQSAGFNRNNGATTIYYLTSLNGTSTTLTTGTRRGCVRWIAAQAGKKLVIPLVSGIIDLGGVFNVDIGNMYFAGEAAPSPGIAFKNGNIRIRASNVVFSHTALYAGAAVEPSSLIAKDLWDCWSIGKNNASISNVVLDHVSGYFGYDELLQVYSAQGFSVANILINACLFAWALHNAGHPEVLHSKGPFIGDTTDFVAFQRSVMAHNVDRNPFTRALHATYKDNAIYNCATAGMIVSGRGQNAAAPTETNIIDNVFVKGPNMAASRKFVKLVGDGNTPIMAGSRVYMDGNVNIGSGFTTQAQMRESQGAVPSDIIAPSILTASMPEGWSRDTIGNALARVQKLHDTAGMRPTDRTGFYDSTVLAHLLNASSSPATNPQGGQIDSVAQAGGHPAPAQNTIADPQAAGAWGGDPFIEADANTFNAVLGVSSIEPWIWRRRDEVET